MADDDDGAGIVGQHLFEEIEGLEIEVVGRFVEDKNIRGQRQRAGQRQPAALAARELFDGGARLFGVNRKSFM